MRNLFALVCLAAAAVLLAVSAGCSVSVTKEVGLVSGNSNFGVGDAAGSQGYVYVPASGGNSAVRQTGNPNTYLFPSPDAALAAHPDWVPATGVQVSAAATIQGASARGAVLSATTDGTGSWTLFASADNLDVTLDFSEATSPSYIAGWADATGAVDPADFIVWHPGLLTRTKDLTTIDGREKITSVDSFSGTCQFTNNTGNAASIAAWLSADAGLGIADLFDYSDPDHPIGIGASGAPTFFALGQFDLPASVGPHTIGISWQDITNRFSGANLAELKRIANPNLNDSLTLYMSCQPAATQLTLNAFTLRVTVSGNPLAAADPAKESPYYELKF